jgi:hypothetical protein
MRADVPLDVGSTTHVLIQDNLHDPIRLESMMDALRDATSWSADHRSQIPTLRYVGPDGTKRIVAMEGAFRKDDLPERASDAPQGVRDVLRGGALIAMHVALSGIVPDLVEQARRREKAFAIVCGSIPSFDDVSSGTVTFASPWKPARVGVFGVNPWEVQQELDASGLTFSSPSTFTIAEGDSGKLGNVSITLHQRLRMVTRESAIAVLRAARVLAEPWP